MELKRNITKSYIFCDFLPSFFKLKLKCNHLELYFQLKAWNNGLEQELWMMSLRSANK